MARFYNQLIVLTLQTNAMLQSSEVPDFRVTGVPVPKEGQTTKVPDSCSARFPECMIPRIPEYLDSNSSRVPNSNSSGVPEFREQLLGILPSVTPGNSQSS